MKKPPEKVKADIAHTVVSAALSAIPYAGGPAQVLFEEIFTKPIEKRREEWLDMLYKTILELIEKVEHLEKQNLSDNPLFISAVMQASQIAQRTHQKEKWEYLLNAIQNTPINMSIDEFYKSLYIRYIEDLTTWHIRILTYFNNPKEWFAKYKIYYPELMAGSPAHRLETAFPDLKGKEEFYSTIVSDLQFRGLIDSGGLNTTMTNEGTLASRTTKTGKQFLVFISKPF